MTFADLLAQLQKLTPEQLLQTAHVWGEQVPYVTIDKIEVAKADYVCEDGECWEVEPGALPDDEEDGEYDPAVKKGEVWLALNY